MPPNEQPTASRRISAALNLDASLNAPSEMAEVVQHIAQMSEGKGDKSAESILKLMTSGAESMRSTISAGYPMKVSSFDNLVSGERTSGST